MAILMGKSTISMAIFNSYVKLPEGTRFWPNPQNIFSLWKMNSSTPKTSQIEWKAHLLIPMTGRVYVDLLEGIAGL